MPAQDGEQPQPSGPQQSLPENGAAGNSNASNCPAPLSNGSSPASLPHQQVQGASSRVHRGRKSKQRLSSAGQAPDLTCSRAEPGASAAQPQQAGSNSHTHGHAQAQVPGARRSQQRAGDPNQAAHDQHSRQGAGADGQQTSSSNVQPIRHDGGQLAQQPHPLQDAGTRQSSGPQPQGASVSAVTGQAADEPSHGASSRPVAVPRTRQMKLSPRQLPCSLPDLSAHVQQQDTHAFR